MLRDSTRISSLPPTHCQGMYQLSVSPHVSSTCTPASVVESRRRHVMCMSAPHFNMGTHSGSCCCHHRHHQGHLQVHLRLVVGVPACRHHHRRSVIDWRACAGSGLTLTKSVTCCIDTRAKGSRWVHRWSVFHLQEGRGRGG